MADFRLGAAGDEVRRIQAALQARQLYSGPVDGVFGGGTEAAVRAFQGQSGLSPDGILGAATWAALFPNAAAPVPVVANNPLEQRCLALTGSFETGLPPPDCFGGIAGDFDKMGLSFGALQWNLGQGTLQPLLRDFEHANPGVIDSIFGDYAAELRAVLAAPKDDQLQWARSIQNARFAIAEPWHGYFKTLGRHPLFIQAETAAAAAVTQRGRTLCVQLHLSSQRALALAFDVVTQDGGISDLVRSGIDRAVRGLSSQLGAQAGEEARLKIIADGVADSANPKWREDVRKRKLTIATGTGTVHGRYYDLAGQYGITLAPM
jgi:Putative peptidoglycan binding domain